MLSEFPRLRLLLKLLSSDFHLQCSCMSLRARTFCEEKEFYFNFHNYCLTAGPQKLLIRTQTYSRGTILLIALMRCAHTIRRTRQSQQKLYFLLCFLLIQLNPSRIAWKQQTNNKTNFYLFRVYNNILSSLRRTWQLKEKMSNKSQLITSVRSLVTHAHVSQKSL